MPVKRRRDSGAASTHAIMIIGQVRTGPVVGGGRKSPARSLIRGRSPTGPPPRAARERDLLASPPCVCV